MVEIIVGLVGLFFGGGVAFVVLNSKNKGKASAIISEAKKDADQLKKEKMLTLLVELSLLV